MILHGIEYQRPTSLNMRIMADHVTYSFLAFMKSIFHFCLGCYCGGYSQNGRSNLSSFRTGLQGRTVCNWLVIPCINIFEIKNKKNQSICPRPQKEIRICKSWHFTKWYHRWASHKISDSVHYVDCRVYWKEVNCPFDKFGDQLLVIHSLRLLHDAYMRQ